MFKNIICLLFVLCAFESSGVDKKTQIIFGTSSMYPPFEYIENGKLKGFDIELANLLAEELGRDATFEDMQFSTLLISLQGNRIDVVIATLAATELRKKNVDFSHPYYFESISAISLKKITNKADLFDKKIASQLGSTMSTWARSNIPNVKLVEFNESNGAIEAVKAGHVDFALVDSVQGSNFVNQNPKLFEKIIAQSGDGYAIAVKKGSPLLSEINIALEKLSKNGKVKQLKEKWMSNK